ncbi:Retaining alpha-galactosidase precursor [Pirellulimonas nuda]|uniref:Retaining alpha-galactosidase n=1 Tax=Pirellulimonas nuda TaxID=2528009 RepID=A0A518D967_9BACT|nr:glycoside hydrolase family 97 protein [Pirellulimonas nuda]QDU88023.1 Retaining alpha-galactosidase precursor [Pirellulimonas nuda]
MTSVRTLCRVGAVLYVLAYAAAAPAEEVARLQSPDGRLTVTLTLDANGPQWQVGYKQAPLVKPSRLGVVPEGAAPSAWESAQFESTRHSETIATVWGKFAEYANDYRQGVWTLRAADGPERTIRIVLRVYDQGVALRYEFPNDGGWDDEVHLKDDATEFAFAGDYTAWSYRKEHDPWGPAPLSTLPGSSAHNPPLTLRGDGDTYACVLEAAIFNGAPFRLTPIQPGGTALRATFEPSTLAPGQSTSWRVLIVGDRPGDLLTAPLPYCLNPPCELSDTDWIKPGLALWDWRAWGARTDDGFQYGLDMPSWRRFIDFASANNIRYLVVDANWYGPEFEKESDPRTSRDHLIAQTNTRRPKIIRAPAPDDWQDPIDMPALIAYAKQRNVGVILYVNDVARRNYPFEETLSLYQQWGAAGIKYGFMSGSGQRKVRATREIVRLCAERHLVCDFHDGPVPPSGDERTYPNYLTREFCHAQSDSLRAFSPSDFCEQVFVNMIAGPLDMNNGLYALKNPAKDRPRIYANVESTVVSETARVLITFSGLAILPDCPEAYAAKADLFEFLRRLPMTWDETRVLHGEIGASIATARRSGDAWYVGAVTNEQPRTLDLSLDFLEPGRKYTATLYEDAPDSHFQTNREAYRIRQIPVDQKSVISAKLAPGGGHCMILEPS